MHTYIRAYIRAYIHTYLYAYIHTYIHTYTYIYVYTFMQRTFDLCALALAFLIHPDVIHYIQSSNVRCVGFWVWIWVLGP